MYTTYIIIIWGSLVIYGGLDAAFNIQDTLAASGENRSKAKKEKKAKKSKGKKSSKGNAASTVRKPVPSGNAKIDKFVDSTFDLNDKIIALKDKLKDVSEDVAESNKILEEIGSHSNGAVGWAKSQLAKGASASSNAVTNKQIPDSPAKFLASKLNTLQSGIKQGAIKLKSIPNDLKVIGNQAQTLLSSAGELPAEAKSLGFKGAPKALKAIKAASGILKNIPNEVTSVGGEAKNVMEEIDQVLKNIQSILGTA